MIAVKPIIDFYLWVRGRRIIWWYNINLLVPWHWPLHGVENVSWRRQITVFAYTSKKIKKNLNICRAKKLKVPRRIKATSFIATEACSGADTHTHIEMCNEVERYTTAHINP